MASPPSASKSVCTWFRASRARWRWNAKSTGCPSPARLEWWQCESALAFLLHLAMLHLGVRLQHQFRHRARDPRRVRKADMGFNDFDLRAATRNDQAARQGGGAGLLRCADEKQMDRLVGCFARRDGDKCAILKKGGVERREKIRAGMGVAGQVLSTSRALLLNCAGKFPNCKSFPSTGNEQRFAQKCPSTNTSR